jgi:carbon-monoxide dehydrogenase large subunit
MNKQSRIGDSVLRIEDPPLVRGDGSYIDDIHQAEMLEVAFVRSPHAHARILSIDTQEALSRPGIVAVLTLADLSPALAREQLPIQYPDPNLAQDLGPFILAKNEAIYVGEPIVIVVAESRYLAEDAAARVVVDFDPLPAAADCKEAFASSAPLVHSGRKTNVVADFRQSYGDIGSAFSRADDRVSVSLKQHRGGAHPIEGRGLIAAYERSPRRLTVWASTQLAHELRVSLMRMLDLDENEVRIITPDVGGGFGAKYCIYADEVAVAAAAVKLRRPLKWIEDRREHFTAAVQERDQYWDLEVACTSDGRMLGVRGTMFHDQGAYTLQGINIAFNSATSFPGPYVLPAYDLRVVSVTTNKVPTAAVRGAGYPQGTFAMERCLDRIATKLGLDRVEVRRRNLISADKIPHTTPMKSRSGSPIVYDSGDFPAILDIALKEIDYGTFPQRQAKARAEGRFIGLGVACGIKGTGRGPYESGLVRIGPSGTISVYSGAAEMGQGIRTALAQICAEQFGASPDKISVVTGDTGTVPLGMGGFSSRQTVTAGSSVHLAASRVREKVLKIASHIFEADVDDLEIIDGTVRIKGVPRDGLGLQQIANVVYGSPGYAIPKNFDPGLESAETFLPSGLTYGMGCHAVELEIDIGTYAPRISRYIVVNDSGRLINPKIVEGQIVGGVVHGIGNALFEWMGFDDNAQPITTTFAEYLLPTSTEVPRIKVILPEYPSPLNPLGVKGVGESGVLPAAAAIVSAIESAMNSPALEIAEIPISPNQLFALSETARKGA